MPNRFWKIVLVGLTYAVLASSSSQGADDAIIRSKRRVRVVDAGGASIGTALSFGQTNSLCSNAITLAMDIRTTSPAVDDTFVIMACRNGFTTSNYLFYEASDCTGQPFFGVAQSGSVNTPVAVAAVDNRGGSSLLYVPDPNGAAENRELRSALDGPTCTGLQQSFPVVSAVAVTDLQTRFAPPFSVR